MATSTRPRGSTSRSGTPTSRGSRCACARGAISASQLPGADLEVAFVAGDEIRTEISAKFTRERITDELAAADLQLEALFTDPDGLFALSLAASGPIGSRARCAWRDTSTRRRRSVGPGRRDGSRAGRPRRARGDRRPGRRARGLAGVRARRRARLLQGRRHERGRGRGRRRGRGAGARRPALRRRPARGSAGPSASSAARARPSSQPFETVVRVNLIGTFNVLRYGAAAISAGDPDDGGERGAVVMTASIAAFDGQIGQTAYAASKGGVVGLTLPAARDLSRQLIRVNTIAPGTFDTPLLAGLPEEAREALGAADPAPVAARRPSRVRVARLPHRREPDAERRDDPARRRAADAAQVGRWRRGRLALQRRRGGTTRRAASTRSRPTARAGRDQTLLVAPPGSGKTVVGLEIVRRLGDAGARAVPDADDPAPVGASSRRCSARPSDDVHLLTYQSLCQADDPDGMLRDGGRAALGGTSARPRRGRRSTRSRPRSPAWTGAAAERREREVARARRAAEEARRAAGKLPDLPADELLSANARARLRGAARTPACASSCSTSAITSCRCGARCCGRCSTSCEPRHVLGLTATNPQRPDRRARPRCTASCSTRSTSSSRRPPSCARVTSRRTRSSSSSASRCRPSATGSPSATRGFEQALTSCDAAGDRTSGCRSWLLARLRERRSAVGRRSCRGRSSRAASRGWPTPGCAGCTRAASRRRRTRRAASASRAPLDDRRLGRAARRLRAALPARRTPSDEAARRLDALQVALGDLGFALTRAGHPPRPAARSTACCCARPPSRSRCATCSPPSTTRAATACARSCCATPSARRGSRTDSPLTLTRRRRAGCSRPRGADDAAHRRCARRS